MDNSIPSPGFSGFRNKIESSVLQAVADHWYEARAGRRMPSWSHLRPSEIAAHLSRVWAFKYDRATGEFTARLAGNKIMLGFGKSFRGTPLRDLHPPHTLERVHANLTRLVSTPACYRCSGQLFKVRDRIVEGERIVMPLAMDGECSDGAIGASAYDFQAHGNEGPVELIEDDVEWFSI